MTTIRRNGVRLPQVKRGAKADYEGMLSLQCRLAGLPEAEREVRFYPTRRWRLDLFFRAAKLAVEVEGAVWTQGRHTRGAGMTEDCEKYAEALILGIRVLRVTPDHVKSGQALNWIVLALAARGGDA